MRRWFLSYNSKDVDLVGALQTVLLRKDAEAQVFFAPKNLRAGGYWLPQLAQEIDEATAFILFVGSKGIGPWQVLEYYEALDKRVKNPNFPVVLLLLEGQPAPGLPFLRQLHWIVSADPTSEQTIVRLFDATAGEASRPGELWRYAAPYRGLASMTETDSDFFFGRTRETVTVLEALAEQTGRMALLVGNSGVGKSSLAQAGVLAALARQSWPDSADAGAWPPAFEDSRRWCIIKLQPGTDPIKALVDPFLRTWQFDPVDPEWGKRQKGWCDALMSGDANLSGLLDATERQHDKLGQPKPPAFFLYVDQGEELYVRSSEQQRRCFSRLIAEGVKDPRLHAVMSLRSDFFGLFQNDSALYDVHRQVNVGPLREGELHEVVRRPSELLGARFEADNLSKDIARRAAAESAKDAGALPLLSYLLDDMWTRMVARGDGILRLPAQAIELGSVLADRANAFLARYPKSERQIRRIFTLKLATVREDGEPTRRRALRSEFTDDEWRSVSELADQPHRLLVVATPESGETYTEVAHESILRHWDKLHAWMVDEREFLIWKTGLEAARRQWQQAPESSRNDALLMGLALSQAQGWLVSRSPDLAPADREFIELSLDRELLERRHRGRLQRRVLYATTAGLLVAIVFGALATFQWYAADRSRTDAEQQRVLAELAAKTADDQRNRALLNDSRRLEELAAKGLGDREPARAALLALEGLPGLHGEEGRPYLPALESMLYQAGAGLMELPPLRALMQIDDGRRFVADDGRGNVGIYDGETGERLVFLTGHTAKVTTIAVRNGIVATGSDDGTARLWDAETGRQLAQLQLGASAFRVAFQADGVLMTTCSNGTAKLWSVPDGKEIFAIAGHTGDVNYLFAHDDVHRALSYGADMTARLWDTTTGRQLAMIGMPAATPAAEGKRSPPQIYGYFNKSGRMALIERRTAGEVSDALILDTATGAEIAHFDDASAGFLRESELVYVVQFNPHHFGLWDPATKGMLVDEETNWELETRYFLLWSETSRTAELLDAATGKRLALLSAQAPIKVVRTLPKSGRIFTAAADGTADFWDSENGRLLQHVADAGAVKYASVLDDDRRLLAEADDGTLSLWDTADGTRLLNLPKQEYSADIGGGNRIAVAVDGDVQVFDAESAKALPKPSLRGEGASNFQLLHSRFSADGRWAATIVSSRKIRIWEVDTGKTIKDLQTPTEDLSTAMQFSPDGSKLLTEKSGGSQSGSKQIWSVESGLNLGVIPATEGTPQFSRHGNLLMLGENFPGTYTTRRTRLWRTDTTSPMTSLWLGGPGTVQRVQFVPGTARLLVVRKSPQPFPFRAEVYDLNAGKRLQELTGPTQNFDASGIGVSDDGRHAAMRSNDDTVRIWDLTTGKVLATIPNVVGARASHDMLLVNGKGDRVQMWSIAAAKMLYVLPDIPGGFDYWLFSSDARYFATWSKSGSTRLWDAESGRQLVLLPEATDAYFSPDGARVFVRLMQKSSAALVETATGRSLAEFSAWQDFVFSRDNKLAVVVTEAQGKSSALVVDTASGQTRASLEIGNQAASDVQLSDDGKAILLTIGGSAGASGGKAELFDGQTGETIALPGEGEEADEYRLSPDGRHVAIVRGAAADLYDIESKTSVPLEALGDKITQVQFNLAGRLVLTASKAGEIRLSDISTGKALDLADGAREPLRFAVLSGHWVVAQSANGTLRTWDTGTSKLVQKADNLDLSENPFARVYPANGLLLVMVNDKFEPGSNVVRMIDESGNRLSEMALGNSVLALGVNEAHDHMLAADYTNGFSLWDLDQSRQIAQMKGRFIGEVSFSFSGDGRRMAAASRSSGGWSLRVWDETGKTEIVSKDVNLASTNTVSGGFSVDSKLLWVLITRFDNLPPELHLLDAATGKPMTDPDLAWTAGRNVLVSPKRDRILFYLSKPGDAVLWDIATSKQIAVIPGLGSDSHPTFSADESWIATASPDHTVKLWDAATGVLRAALSGHTGAVQALAISNDGRYLASGSSDGTARVWNVETGKAIDTLRPSAAGDLETARATVQQVLFSGDGTKLATRTDRLINLWNVASGEQVAALPLQSSSTPMSFSPDGRLLLRGTNFENPSPLLNRVFPQVQDAVAAARQASPSCLTPTERKAAFLDPEPPFWCIELEKPPYDTEQWQSWLTLRRSGQNAPLPNP